MAQLHNCQLLFKIKVNVFDKPNDSGVQRSIRIECPGVVDDDIEWEELPNGVKARLLLLSLLITFVCKLCFQQTIF